MALSTGLLLLFGEVLKFSAAAMFLILGLLTLVLAVVTIVLLPDFLVRLIVALLTRLCYRIKAAGIENVPAEGGVLLVCNHAAWVDPLLIGSTQARRIRFVMGQAWQTCWGFGIKVGWEFFTYKCEVPLDA